MGVVYNSEIILRSCIEGDDTSVVVRLPVGCNTPFQLGKVFLCPIDPIKSALKWMG
jgi:hypothetical protein